MARQRRLLDISSGGFWNRFAFAPTFPPRKAKVLWDVGGLDVKGPDSKRNRSRQKSQVSARDPALWICPAHCTKACQKFVGNEKKLEVDEVKQEEATWNRFMKGIAAVDEV